MKKLITLFAVAGMVLALAPAAQAMIVPITNVTTSGSIDLDSFTAGGTLYTTATDLSLGTSVNTGSTPGSTDDIGNQDNFDLNLIFSRGGNAALDETWTVSLFGGANWSDTNGDAADFFIFEAGGNDSISVRPIFVGGGVGQYTVLSTKGGTVNWGSTGVTITGPIRNGDTIYGLGFAITDLKDGSGNPLLNSSVIMGLDFDGFNTDIASISAVPAPETDPAITFKNPDDAATDVAIDANLVATFDEYVVLTGSGTVTIKDLDTPAETVINLPDAQVTVSGAVLTINPTNNLLPDNSYAVRISADAVEDLATPPNAFAGILNDTTWNFDTWVALAAGVYEHPGGLHTQAQLDYVRQKVIDQVEPWDSAYDQLLSNAVSWLSESPRAMPVFTVPRYYGDDQAEHIRVKNLMSEDASVAYSCALVYQLNINLEPAQRETYADKAMEFLNNWAYTNVAVAGEEVVGEDSLLVMCYNGTALAFAAELLWDYSGWSTTDKNQFKSWAGTVLSGAASIKTRSNNWANWGIMASLAANHIRDDTSMMASDIDRLKTIIDQQIEPDGSMPEELARGDNSVWYTYFALAPMTAAIEITRNAEGIVLYPYVPPSGGTVKDALDFFFQHAIVDPSSWPVEGASNTLIPDGKGGNLFYAMGRVYGDEDYLDWVSHPIWRGGTGLCWICPSLMSPFGENASTTTPAAGPVAGVTVVDIGVDTHSYLGYSDWNTSLTLDASGNAYAVFVDSNFKNTVAKVTPGGVVTTQIIDTTNNLDDQGHNTPSIAIDGDGFLHVAYNMHNHNMRLRKSPAANTVSGTWVDEGGTGSPWGAGRFTYPAMSTAPNGDAYMSIRNREIGGPAQLFHYNSTTDSWSSIAKFADESGYTAYLPAPYVASDGKVHLVWHWALGGPGGIRHLGSYAVYDPIEDSFSKADGTEYTIPITTTTADPYQPREADWGEPGISDHSVTVNALGQPIIAYNFFREGDNDQRVIRLARWDGSEWQRTDLEGPETGTTLGDPVLVNRDGTLYIYFNDADGKLTLRSSTDDGLTFGDAITLTGDAVRAAHVLIGGASIGSNKEAIFFLDTSDNYAAKVMFVDYAQVGGPPHLGTVLIIQ